MSGVDPLTSLLLALVTVRDSLVSNRSKLLGIEKQKELDTGMGEVMAADLWAERELVPHVHHMWPKLPVLCEESENSGLAELVPGIKLLPYKDDISTLPDDFISVDGLDGSALYANEELALCAISIGVISEGNFNFGIIIMLNGGIPHVSSAFQRSAAPRQKLSQCLIGLDDNKAVDDVFRRLVINKLASSRATRYPINCPTVAGAMKVLRGNFAAYVTSNARNWDIAGVGAFFKENGMIFRCLDGSPIPLHCVRMPPLVFARDEEAFEYVHTTAQEYLAQTS
jgi:fructose-1,6-bisphosphatase/inositol monophosphatase family enzyme